MMANFRAAELKADGGFKNDIVEILEDRDCVVKTISIYENNSINYSKEEMDKIFNQKIDFITFTSGSSCIGYEPNRLRLLSSF